jgi:gamma-glutamyl-gamma-aminobutyrate hydrolase PuuD
VLQTVGVVVEQLLQKGTIDVHSIHEPALEKYRPALLSQTQDPDDTINPEAQTKQRVFELQIVQ